MNTIKTLVVVTTLLAVGYGAHVVLNKPIPNGQFAQDAAFPQLPGFEKPSLQIDSDGEGPQVSLPPLKSSSSDAAFAGSNAVQLPQLDSPAGSPIANRFARQPSPPSLPADAQQFQPTDQAPSLATATSSIHDRMTGVAGPTAETADPTSPASLATGHIAANATSASPPGGAQAESRQMAESASNGLAKAALAGSQLPHTFGQSIAQAAGGAQHAATQQMQNIPTSIGSPGPPAQMTSATIARPYGEKGRFDEVWFMAQSKLQNGQLVDALLTLSMYFNDTSLTTQQRDQLVPLLDQLAGSVIYSNTEHIEAPYEVQPQDTLQSVAQAYRVTPSFIMRTNGLSSPALHPGQMIKVVRGPFRSELSLSRRELTLFAGRYYAGRFPVAIGRDLPSEASMLEVTEVSGAKPYADPRTGEQIPPAAANNPYGNHWVGLRDAGATHLTGLGLHSSGSSVDASDSRGCISLSDEDAEDLQAILTVGSRIQIVP